MKTYKYNLIFKDKTIATLKFEDGYWYFKYTDNFFSMGLRPFTMDTPDINVETRSSVLWQFFERRIPDTIKQLVPDMSEEWKAEFFSGFHSYSVNDPFVLIGE